MTGPVLTRRYDQWAIRRPGDANAMGGVLFWNEKDAKESAAAYAGHGEPVEIVKRALTVTTANKFSDFEVVQAAPELSAS